MVCRGTRLVWRPQARGVCLAPPAYHVEFTSHSPSNLMGSWCHQLAAWRLSNAHFRSWTEIHVRLSHGYFQRFLGIWCWMVPLSPCPPLCAVPLLLLGPSLFLRNLLATIVPTYGDARVGLDAFVFVPPTCPGHHPCTDQLRRVHISKRLAISEECDVEYSLFSEDIVPVVFEGVQGLV